MVSTYRLAFLDVPLPREKKARACRFLLPRNQVSARVPRDSCFDNKEMYAGCMALHLFSPSGALVSRILSSRSTARRQRNWYVGTGCGGAIQCRISYFVVFSFGNRFALFTFQPIYYPWGGSRRLVIMFYEFDKHRAVELCLQYQSGGVHSPLNMLSLGIVPCHLLYFQ